MKGVRSNHKIQNGAMHEGIAPSQIRTQTADCAAGSTSKSLRKNFLHLVRDGDLSGADILNVRGGRALHVAVVAVEVNRALDMNSILHQLDVFYPKLHVAFGVGDGRAAAAHPAAPE